MNAPHQAVGPLQQSTDFELGFRLRLAQSAKPKACVILLHGVGGSENDLAPLAADISPDTLVVLPRGRLEFGTGQFAWFRVAFTASGPRIVESEAEQSRLTLARFVEQIQAQHGIEPTKSLIAGFSQGGIMSASVALSAPALVAGFALLSGRILPELAPRIAAKHDLATLQAFIGHGEYDSKLPVAWAQRADRLLDDLGVQHQTRLYPIDHGISAAMQTDFLAWLEERLSTR